MAREKKSKKLKTCLTKCICACGFIHILKGRIREYVQINENRIGIDCNISLSGEDHSIITYMFMFFFSVRYLVFWQRKFSKCGLTYSSTFDRVQNMDLSIKLRKIWTCVRTV